MDYVLTSVACLLYTSPIVHDLQYFDITIVHDANCPIVHDVLYY